MSLETIRKTFWVPAFKGTRVGITLEDTPLGISSYQEGYIIGCRDNYLKIKLDSGIVRLCHPTRNIEYFN